MGGSSSKHKDASSTKQAPPASSSPPTSKVSDADRAVLRLKRFRDQLNRSCKSTEAKLESQRKAAAHLARAGNKERAIEALKRARAVQNSLARTESLLDNVRTLIDSTEQAQQDKAFLSTMKDATESLKALQVELEDAEKVMDDAADAVAAAEATSEALTMPIASTADDDALLAELEELAGGTPAATVKASQPAATTQPSPSSTTTTQPDPAAVAVGAGAVSALTGEPRAADLEALRVEVERGCVKPSPTTVADEEVEEKQPMAA